MTRIFSPHPIRFETGKPREQEEEIKSVTGLLGDLAEHDSRQDLLSTHSLLV
jgi:hypothetical protein